MVGERRADVSLNESIRWMARPKGLYCDVCDIDTGHAPRSSGVPALDVEPGAGTDVQHVGTEPDAMIMENTIEDTRTDPVHPCVVVTAQPLITNAGQAVLMPEPAFPICPDVEGVGQPSASRTSLAAAMA